MSATDSSFGSNNPFRRNTLLDPSPVTTTTSGSFLDAASSLTSTPRPPPPFTTFKTASANEPDVAARGGQPVQTKPKKIVKKVRVQSPPPSSPEDATPVRSYPPDAYGDDSSSDSSQDVEQIDPFNSGFTGRPKGSIDGEPPLPRPPPNPFAKTLQDLEHNVLAQEGQPGAGAKGGALDVDSFKRLLLTGYANIPGPGGQGAIPGSQQTTAHDGASNTDASSVSRQSILDAIQETPRTSHEISETEESAINSASPLSNVQSASGRKKPPPPSSRHGKLIKMEFGTDATAKKKGPPPPISVDTSSSIMTPNRTSSVPSVTQPSPPSSSDVNKPLPLPPRRHTGEDDMDSPFDREAAGKIPEYFAAPSTDPQPPTPPGGPTRGRSGSQTSTRTTSSAQLKPAAPPPRRHNHSRSDSKQSTAVPDRADEDAPRSSFESNRSRADSLRVNVSSDKNSSVPAPPPPRRPNHARQGSAFASPVTANFTNIPSPGTSEESRSPGIVGFNPLDHQNLGAMATVTHSKDGLPKLSPPPPPPARHSSLRRPSSSHSTDTGSIRRVSREKEGGTAPPPPPPPRVRGNSKVSLAAAEAHGVVGRTRTSGAVSKVDEEPAPITEDVTTEPGTGDDIMGQLKALQQEVEAARKASR